MKLLIVSVIICRDESWGGKGSKNGTEDRPEEQHDENYEGPAGMDPDGIIESNWDKVKIPFPLINFRCFSHNI